MIELIPAIDIINGKCVRLTKGDYANCKTYSENPVDVAKMMEDVGCNSLHLVDLDGAKSKHIVNYKTLEQIATKTNLKIDFGGGLKSDEDLRIAFDCGASMITGGSIAVKSPEVFCHWIEKYGAECVILGADARNGKISTSGWLDDSDWDIVEFIKHYVQKGIRQVISTDINVDGTLTGPSVDMYKNISNEVPEIYMIASGGVGCYNDILKLEQSKVPAVIVGKAIYEGFITMDEVKSHNLSR